MIGFRNGREAGISLARHPFFFLDNQVIRVFCLNDRLIILRVVTHEVCGKICSQVARNRPKNHLAGHLLKDGNRLEKDMDSLQAGLQARICVRVGMLGPLLSFNPFGPSK